MKRHSTVTSRITIFIIVLIACISSSCSRNGLCTFDVPSGKAAATLKIFAAQADIDILINGSELGKIETHQIAGEMPIDDALKQMTRGTGLKFHYDENSHAIIVFHSKQ